MHVMFRTFALPPFAAVLHALVSAPDAQPVNTHVQYTACDLHHQ